MHKSVLFIILFILISGMVYIFSNQHTKSLQQEITSAKERNNILEQENKSLKEQNKSLSQQADQVALQPITDPQKQEVEGEKPFPIDVIESFPGDNFKKTLSNGLEVDVVITNKEENEVELRFSNYEITQDAYSFRGSEYKTYAFEESTFFNFTFIGLDTNEFYLKDSSGHETIPQHYIVKGTHLINLGELLKGVLADKFPNELFPQINLTFYPSFIRIEEEKYCCDTLHDVTNPERENYRKIFIVDRKTYTILKEEKVARAKN